MWQTVISIAEIISPFVVAFFSLNKNLFAQIVLRNVILHIDLQLRSLMYLSTLYTSNDEVMPRRVFDLTTYYCLCKN